MPTRSNQLNRKRIISGVMLIAFAATSTLVHAKTVRISKSVSSGKRVQIDRYMGWNNDCSFQTINIDVVQKPKSGSTDARVVNSKISKAQSGSSGKCFGKPIKGLGVYYKSKSGYRGQDSMKIRMKVRGQAPVTFIYNIKVR